LQDGRDVCYVCCHWGSLGRRKASAMHLPHPVRSLATAGAHWWEDSTWQMGAALAYYSLFLLLPVLIAAAALIAFVYGEELATEQAMSRMARAIGGDGATLVDVLIENFRRPADARWAAAIGLCFLGYGAISVSVQLRNS